MRLAYAALTLSTGAWVSLLIIWAQAWRATPRWQLTVWFDEMARRGYVNEAWVEGALFVGAIALNLVAMMRLLIMDGRHLARGQRHDAPSEETHRTAS